MNEQVKQFFVKYEQANSNSDVSTICSLYAETFMFGGPNGVQAVKKEDFLKIVPTMKANYASMGLVETTLHSVEMSLLDSKYLLAAVVWRIKLQDTFDKKYVDASATYVLERAQNDSLAIVFQVDHQDLANVVRGMQSTAR